MEEKLVINELQQGKELANRLMNNLKQTSSIDSNKILISEILRIYQNAIFMLSFNNDNDNKNNLKRKSEINDKGSKKRKKTTSENKTEKVKVYVGTGQDKNVNDDGYCWRKYGQKEIHGSINPRGYYRCTHRFTLKCLAVKQVQKSDEDPSIYEVKYRGEHTCNNINTSPSPSPTTTNFSVSMFEKRGVTEKVEEDVKPMAKTEEVIISLDDLENKKNIFRTFSFSNYEYENVEWKSNIFSENLEEKLSPATSSSGITNEIVNGLVSGENYETVDSYFSNLDNFVEVGQDWLWS
ncbi:hypothetical protein AALP_AA4G252800 [Arabis alpina]|uniref:WRKY domain-containing protein n=1 Tax=Arabis alpina TaxID=50452 RepID=A0A087H5K4_ARAAL|nr:hypothetical protein AALP_AA4G252800 [Arabis alpina]